MSNKKAAPEPVTYKFDVAAVVTIDITTAAGIDAARTAVDHIQQIEGLDIETKLCGLIEAHMVIRTAQLSSEALRTRMGRYADTELGIDLAGLKTRIDLEGRS